ncbi:MULTISPECIES: hypothetical protein [unclassified Variovorax]|uniref:hypothetical protein n=1 Tax=unclassified Variovorax TaxID=663243 RepID=UPI00076C898E|nr:MULTISPECIES: hypothetical protein [unclassified Variovorax]KWT69523.1 hypothetical protein APY03_6883 [Variovorax sp. WDL1]PNG48838.1 hypothetical protein CHC06_06606 [Variovorax sp. B2]PNG49345.1 hypothetical protein CHC07_06254 [Variovorax sp. B4]VTV18364.1 hypothetical protein WDL1P2_00070 [Variovorax sp. WDL1]
MMQVFHLKVARAGQLNPAVVDMHARIAFRVDRDALAEIFSEEVKWREVGLSFELVAEVEGDNLERAFSATNHIDSDWSGNPGVQVKTTASRRSTSVGDLVMRDGTTFVVDKFGFSEIQRPMPIEPEDEPETAELPRC